MPKHTEEHKNNIKKTKLLKKIARYQSIDWYKFQTEYDSGKTIRECLSIFHIHTNEYAWALKEKLFKPRTRSESRKNAKSAPPVSNDTKELLSIHACGRLSKHSKYSKNIEYKPGIILESSYEVRTAEILDSLCIDWIKVRHGYIWDDSGKRRRYVPDFYLPKYNLFLDPKNDYLIKKDKRKINSAMELNNIKVVILSNDMINKEFIELLVL